MGYEDKRVKVHDILFDPANPRHDPIEAEPEIIKYFVDHEGVRGLAASVAKLGSLSPIEKMAVTPHPTLKGRYTTAEGNRRLCALRLLTDPERAPTEAARKVFRDLRDKMGGPIKDLDVVVFDTFEETRPWVELRHGGYRGGEGAKEWNSRQKTRFDKAGQRTDNPNALALALIGYARANDLITPEEAEELSLTTLTRFLANPVFRSTMGITTKPTDNRVEINVDERQFRKALARFLHDSLATGTAVHSRTSVKDRVKYAKELTSTGVAPKARRGTSAVELNAETGASRPSATTAPTTPRRDNRDPRKRLRVIPTNFSAHIADPILRRIYGELKKVDPVELPFAANYLFRALIELTARRFCAKNNVTFLERDLHKTLLKIDEKLQADGVRGHVLKGIRVMASKNDVAYSPESLGSVVHGNGVANRRDLNDGWDSVAAGLSEMWRRI